jgi:hypothetical protein
MGSGESRFQVSGVRIKAEGIAHSVMGELRDRMTVNGGKGYPGLWLFQPPHGGY